MCEESRVPDGVRVERGFRTLQVDGPLSFKQTGVLESLLKPLAAESVPVFVVSTFDTDYILVPAERLTHAIEALRKAGHPVTE